MNNIILLNNILTVCSVLLYIYPYVHVRMYVCMHVCARVCVHVYINECNFEKDRHDDDEIKSAHSSFVGLPKSPVEKNMGKVRFFFSHFCSLTA